MANNAGPGPSSSASASVAYTLVNTTDKFETFSKKMLDEKVVSCASCLNLLSIPIFLIENIGNCCEPCKTTKHANVSNVRNGALEKVLLELMVPCQYSATGCKDTMNYKELEDHQKKCLYQTTECIFKLRGCAWVGLPAALATHVEQLHPSHVIDRENNNSFILNLNLTSDYFSLKLLRQKYRPSYFLKIINDNIDLWYVLCDSQLEHQSQSSQFKFNLKHLTAQSNNHIDVACYVLPLSKLNELKDATKVNVNYLKETTGESDNITLIVTSELNDVLYDKMIDALECPVCTLVMRPPIYVCSTGHSICRHCKKRLVECPTCTASFKDETRSFGLESLASFVYYQCRFHPNGCTQYVLDYTTSRKHELVCPYQPNRPRVTLIKPGNLKIGLSTQGGSIGTPSSSAMRPVSFNIAPSNMSRKRPHTSSS